MSVFNVSSSANHVQKTCASNNDHVNQGFTWPHSNQLDLSILSNLSLTIDVNRLGLPQSAAAGQETALISSLKSKITRLEMVNQQLQQERDEANRQAEESKQHVALLLQKLQWHENYPPNTFGIALPEMQNQIDLFSSSQIAITEGDCQSNYVDLLELPPPTRQMPVAVVKEQQDASTCSSSSSKPLKIKAFKPKEFKPKPRKTENKEQKSDNETIYLKMLTPIDSNKEKPFVLYIDYINEHVIAVNLANLYQNVSQSTDQLFLQVDLVGAKGKSRLCIKLLFKLRVDKTQPISTVTIPSWQPDTSSFFYCKKLFYKYSLMLGDEVLSCIESNEFQTITKSGQNKQTTKKRKVDDVQALSPEQISTTSSPSPKQDLPISPLNI